MSLKLEYYAPYVKVQRVSYIPYFVRYPQSITSYTKVNKVVKSELLVFCRRLSQRDSTETNEAGE